MLKIKDSVNLKETLKKYDMKYDPTTKNYVNNYKFINLWINEDDRVINIEIDDSIYILNKHYIENKEKAKDILYDLIKADLVEEIEDSLR